ncbi:hypothetical protein ACQPYK_48815 (plasmid) [Streptosporangium sp. CA-135522]|uniref:hypothetical protein n=1 Tax=Streptosporangium sp. CA-135522 TaxID=3240072 RepID=UPI003D93AD63
MNFFTIGFPQSHLMLGIGELTWTPEVTDAEAMDAAVTGDAALCADALGPPASTSENAPAATTALIFVMAFMLLPSFSR